MFHSEASRAFVAASVAWLLWPMWAAAGDAPDRAEIEHRRQQLEKMPPEELQAIKRKFEEFQKLPPAERDRLRRIHQAVEADPKLQRTLAGYHQWVAGLGEEDRRQLRESSREKRMEVIHEIMRRQAEHQGDPRPSGAGPFALGRFGRPRPEIVPGLMEWYQSKLEARLSADERQALQAAQPMEKRRKTVQHARRLNLYPWGPAEAEPPPAEVLQALQRRRPGDRSAKGGPQDARARLRGYLNAIADWPGGGDPRAEALRDLPPEERKELQRRLDERFRRGPQRRGAEGPGRSRGAGEPSEAENKAAGSPK